MNTIMMSRFLVSFFALLLTSFTFVSCDEHEPLDLDIHPGFILCDDGSVMSNKAYFEQDTRKAVAVVFAGETADHGVLAVCLHEIDAIQFCDTLGMELGTSCDVTAYDGYLNTTAMQNSRDTRTGKGSPLADEAFSYHHFWQSDYIPSVAEMTL